MQAAPSVEQSMPTPFKEPSATASPISTPIPPTAASQPLTTRVSTADPSDAARSLLDHMPASTTPVASGPTSILFVSWRDGVAEIYRMKEDGSGQVRLT